MAARFKFRPGIKEKLLSMWQIRDDEDIAAHTGHILLAQRRELVSTQTILGASGANSATALEKYFR